MDPKPIRQIGWSEWGNYTRDPRRLPAVASNPWKPCPSCWGQRRQYAQGSEGTWFVRTCPRCLGIGDVPSVTS